MIDLGVVNLHLTHRCNYKCIYCHSNFFASKEKNILPFKLWKEIIDLLEPYCTRINIAGGEPLIHKSLIGQILEHNHKLGLISTIITNGYYLDISWINKYGIYLKAIGISCDSAQEEIQSLLVRGQGQHVERTIANLLHIHQLNKEGGNILTKLNTVVNAWNYKENMVDFILKTRVKRWKVFQLLTIQGENEENAKDLIITKNQFQEFCKNNESVQKYGVHFVAENQEELTDTYVMIDPEGRFFSNTSGKYLFSDPIYMIGVEPALEQINFNEQNLLNLDRMFL